MANARYILGLDLGQAHDFTALAVLKQAECPLTRSRSYVIPFVKRWPLGTPYPEIVAEVAAKTRQPPVPKTDSLLVVDRTGVGQPIMDLLAREPLGVTLSGITITAGHAVTGDSMGNYAVPKKELVSVLGLLLPSRRLDIKKGVAEAAVLKKELHSFSVKITIAAHETFGTWREGEHDDLVLAVAMAVWAGERIPERYRGPIAYTGLVEDKIGKETREDVIQRSLDAMDRDEEVEWWNRR